MGTHCAHKSVGVRTALSGSSYVTFCNAIDILVILLSMKEPSTADSYITVVGHPLGIQARLTYCQGDNVWLHTQSSKIVVKCAVSNLDLSGSWYEVI